MERKTVRRPNAGRASGEDRASEGATDHWELMANLASLATITTDTKHEKLANTKSRTRRCRTCRIAAAPMPGGGAPPKGPGTGWRQCQGGVSAVSRHVVTSWTRDEDPDELSMDAALGKHLNRTPAFEGDIGQERSVEQVSRALADVADEALRKKNRHGPSKSDVHTQRKHTCDEAGKQTCDEAS